MWIRARLCIFAVAVAFTPLWISAQEEVYEPRLESRNALIAIALQKAESLAADSAFDESRETYRKALQDIYEAIDNDRKNPTGYLHLGVAKLGLGEYLAADSAFDQAETLYPPYFDEQGGTGAFRENGWIDAYNDGITALDAEDNDKALGYFTTANVMFDKRPEAFLNLAATYANTGQNDASVDAWESAIAVIDSPDSRPRDEETRLDWLNKYRPMALMNLAQILASGDRAEEAIAIYRELLEKDPDNDRARSGLAIALGQSGQAEDALSVYDEILNSDDAPPLDYFNAGVTLYGAEDYDRARVAFEKVLAGAPMYRDALQNLAQTLNLIEAYEEQIPYTERLLEMDGHNYLAYQMHVRALSQLGRGEEVAASLAKMQNLPFIVDNLQLQPRSDGGRVLGIVANKLLEEGASVILKFSFYDSQGDELTTQDVSVQLGDVDVAQQFQTSIDTEVRVMGYSYEVIN
jgi:tetratricopeptide (TPR) repeat protein